MKAAMHDQYGGPDVVSIREVELPVPVDDQVLVRVRAASVNRADLGGLYPRWAFTRLFLGLRAPKTGRVGLDVAGVVESLGPTVTAFKPGDSVFGDLSNFGSGAFAEYVCAPERAFATTPEGMLPEDAATLPHSAILALRALSPRHGRTLSAGSACLSSARPGTLALSRSRSRSRSAPKSRVSQERTSSTSYARSTLTMSSITRSTTTRGQPVGSTGSLTWNAHHPLLRWRATLKPGGVYVALAGSTWWLVSSGVLGPIVSRATGKRLGLIYVRPFQPEDVERLKELVAAGTVRPIIDGRFSLEEVVEALRRVDEGRTLGKVLIIP